jgi:hypothetical protein
VTKLPIRSLAALALALSGAAASAQTLIYDLPGQSAGDQLGSALGSAGDFDGDGFTDLLVGSPAAVGGRGVVQVISGATGVVLHTWIGGAPGDLFGSAVSGGLDLDGDGRSEVAVGAPLADGGNGAGSGAAYVYSGGSGAQLWSFAGDSAADHFGFSVLALSDVSGDGVADFAFGALDDDNAGNGSGSVRVVSGASGAALYSLNGTAASQLFGYALCALPDRDGDGTPEIAIGAPGTTASSFLGYVRIVSGASGVQLDLYSGTWAKDNFGSALAPAGDLDGDGIVDLLVGAPQKGSGATGYARTISASGAVISFLPGDSAQDQFGASVACAGDVDGDGLCELLVGAPGDDDQGIKSGSARLHSGASGAALFTIHGQAASWALGSALAGNLDLNGDGVPELVLGAPGGGSAGPGAGSARVISAKSLPLHSPTHLVSMSSPGAQVLELDAGPAFAGRPYAVLGSFSGTAPGIPIGALHVPLNPDRYFGLLRLTPGQAPLSAARGVLDPQGKATVLFQAGQLSSAALGLSFHHAYIVAAPSGMPAFVSNAVPASLLP